MRVNIWIFGGRGLSGWGRGDVGCVAFWDKEGKNVLMGLEGVVLLLRWTMLDILMSRVIFVCIWWMGRFEDSDAEIVDGI